MVISFTVLLWNIGPQVHALSKAAVIGTKAIARPAQSTKSLPFAPVPRLLAANGEVPGPGRAPVILAESNSPSAPDPQELEKIHVTQLPPARQRSVIGIEGPSRKVWLLLSIADHSAAAFDAFSTRSAISRGAVEADPLIRPFAGSDGLYAAIQVAPLTLDFVARRMQRSQHTWLRRTWWVPGSVSTGLFLFAGAHNLTVARR